MNPDTIPPDIERLAASLPKFPDGRIDYHTAAEAAALNVFVMCRGKLLLVKRGQKVGWLKGKWHVVAGFLDEMKPLRQKALEEMEEELGISPHLVHRVHAAEPFREELGKLWIIYPVLVELLEEPNISLDWENTDFTWIDPHDAEKYDVVPSVLHQLRMLDLIET